MDRHSGRGSIGYTEAVAIGIGGMVGGGIFAVLGLAVGLSGGGTPVSFAVAGLVALITAYSYAKLSVAFPSRGGTVTFLVRGFGAGLLSGGLNILLWISYIVMLSLYAYAFGSYGATFFPAESQLFWKHVLITASIAGITALNILGAEIIGRAEDLIVGIKIAILLLFLGAGAFGIQHGYLAPATWPPLLRLVSGGMIIFVAYEGFELIANTARDVRNPAATLPKAYYTSVLAVIALYVLIAVVTVGTLPPESIAAARDYALAEAAKPSLGQLGFVLIAIAALLSTASAINATLYGSARFSYCIARYGELPELLEKKIWDRPLEGLFITAAVTLVIANLLDLSSISTMGSAGFLLIFAMVNAANVRLARSTDSSRIIPVLGCLACAGAFGALVWEAWQTAPHALLVLGGMIALSFGIELVYRELRPGPIRPGT
jgi:amino acid transporter